MPAVDNQTIMLNESSVIQFTKAVNCKKKLSIMEGDVLGVMPRGTSVRRLSPNNNRGDVKITVAQHLPLLVHTQVPLLHARCTASITSEPTTSEG